MKKLVLRILSIAAAFFLGVLGMGYYLMAGNTDSTGHMASASLPLIYLEQNGRSFNLLHGYTAEMDASCIRDAVLPLPEDREISLRIESPDVDVNGIRYEVRSKDMSRLVEDGELTETEREGDTISADFQLMDLLEDGEEYLLVVRLELEQEQAAYYYTHIVSAGETHLEECLHFVDTIHEALFDKNNTVSIAQYMETDSSADNNTLDYVSIHSRYSQMIWADMEIEAPDGEVRTYITEAESSVVSVRLEYETGYVNEDGGTERYEVTESFRVRYTEQRMYLLNYERRVDRIFDPSSGIFTDRSVILGILNTDVEYRKNEEENIVGFVQNGQLWSYDVAQNKLSLVFGFREGEDLRGSCDDHGIRILSLSESGSMDFLVYGYMNRGLHEGRTGVALYSFDALTNSVEERVFLESARSFAAIEAELGELAYVNDQQEFYLYLDGGIYRIDLNTLERERIAANVAAESCMVSSDGKWAAWQQEGSLYEATSLTVLNLETGSGRTVYAGEGCCIRALGFMGTDFIYGEARQSDVQQDAAGNPIFPMARVVIQDQYGQEVRSTDYESRGKYVVDIAIEGNRISLDCVQRAADGGYEETDPETITSSAVEAEEKILLETRNAGDKKREYYFSLAEGHGSGSLRQLTPEQVVFEGSRSLSPGGETADGRYYAYAYDGSFLGAWEEAKDAIPEAYEAMGSVVDCSGGYIWKRGGRQTRTDLGSLTNPQQNAGESSLQAALEILLGTQNVYSDVDTYLSQGYTPLEILTEQMDGRILDLSGCSVSMIQYYISQDCPVLALLGGTEAELITGYDQQNLIVTDPLTGESFRRGLGDSTQLYEERGNLFLVCLSQEDN